MAVTSRPAPVRRPARAAAASSAVSALRRIAAALPLMFRRSPSARRNGSSEPALAGSARPVRGGHASRFVLPVFAGAGGGTGRALAGAALLLSIGAFAALPAQAQTLSEIPNLRVTPVMGATDKLDVSWDAPTGTTVTYYAVQWKSGAQQYDNTRVIQNTGANPATTAQITGLTANTAHDVRVTAVGGIFLQRVARSEVAGTRTHAANSATIAAKTSPVTEGTAAVFTVTLTTAAPASGLNFSISVADATGSDFVAAADEGVKTVSFAAGETSKDYSVATVDDGDDEPDGAVTATLLAATGYTLGNPSSAAVTVNDDDVGQPGVTVTPREVIVAEADDTTTGARENVATYTVVLDTQPAGNVTVTPTSRSYGLVTDPLAATVSTARSDDTLVFTTSNWSTPQTVTVTGVDDAKVNGRIRAETVTHSVSGYGGVTAPNVLVAVTDDDDTSAPSFAADASIDDRTFTVNQEIERIDLPRVRSGDRVTYSLSPSPPSGLTFSANTLLPVGVKPGNLTGTPTAVQGATQYTYTATDRQGRTASLRFSIAVVSDDLMPSFAADASIPNQSWLKGREIAALTLPEATGGNLPVSYNVVSDPLEEGLPEGVSFDRGTRTLSGTPTETLAATQYTYRVWDADGDKAELTFTIAVTLPALADLAVSPVSGETTKLAVSWTAFTGAEKYLVRWKTGSGSFNAGEETTGSSYTIPGLTADTAYTVEVSAIDTDAGSDDVLARSEANGTTLDEMGTITVDAVTGATDKLDVSWTDINGDVGYRVQWKESTDASYSTMTNSHTTAAGAAFYRIVGLTAGTAYDVKVTAQVSIGGSTADGDSGEGEGTTTAATAGQTQVVTAWFTISRSTLRVDENGGTGTFTVTLNQDPSADFARARVALQVPLTPAGAVRVSTHRLTFNHDDWWTPRTVTVTGLDDDEPGDRVVPLEWQWLGVSGTVTVTVTSDEQAAADWQPAVSGEDDSIRVSWPKLVDATGYRVQWKTGSQDWSTAERVHTTDAAARGYSILRLTVGTTYYVRVTGLGSAGDLKVSDEFAHFTHGYQDAYADPAEGDARAIDVEWELVPGAAGYAVEWDVASSGCHETRATPALAESMDVTGEATVETTITGLQPDTDYYVRVTAYTANGSASAPDGLSWTDCATPTNTEITEVAVAPVTGSSTELDVSWTIGTTAHAFPIVGYVVRWKPDDADDYPDGNEATVDTGKTYRIGGLTAGTTYDVRVTARIQEFPTIPNSVYDGDATDGGAAGGDAGVGNAEDGDVAVGAGTTEVAEAAAPVRVDGPSFTVYHDPDLKDAAANRYDTAVGLLDETGWLYTVRRVTGTDEVDRLAGVSNSIIPRFFLGDPEDPDWGPSQPKVNNGGLRWLRAKLAALQASRPVPGVSVADARVHEAADAVLAFAVTLDRAPERAATVAYATSDGTATAGADYTATSGTLTFAAGETAKTVSVPVLDDAHDEGEETLTLTLSNPSGLRIVDGEATGTIENTDAMPGAWLVRMGRTIGSQAVDALDSRFAETGGSHGTLGGQAVTSGAASDGTPQGMALGAGAERPWWQYTDDRDPRGGEAETRTMTLEQFLLGTSFHLAASERKETGGPGMAVWGRFATTSFEGEAGGIDMDGTVTSGFFGADAEWDRLLGGVMVSHSLGEGTYGGPAGKGEVESTLSGVYPYAKLDLSGRVSVWGLAGAGWGALTLKPDGQRGMETDINLRMGALGVTGRLLDGEDGVALDVRSDAMWVGTESDAVAGMAASETEATRLRLVLDGSRTFEVGGGATLTPSAELGLRVDGGDAETGFGTEAGAGVAWSDPERGLSAEVKARGLLTHEDSGFSERGVSGGLTWDPRPDSERGPTLTLSQILGASDAGGVDALLERDDLAGLAANDNGWDRRRFEARLGYGVPAFGGTLTGTPEFAVGLSDTVRDYTLAWRLTPERSGPQTFEFRVEGLRRESVNLGSGSGAGGPSEHGFGIRLNARW